MLGEVRPFAFRSSPRHSIACHGQELSINQNLALFSIVGTRFGGDGDKAFALPTCGASRGSGTGIRRTCRTPFAFARTNLHAGGPPAARGST